ncbi:hypothetical protein [Olleya namhaensis]|uniref:hypothetical protein n=1 Tax=Olleya namhaensis TaxID=1144750 RepID=UPI0024932BD6|nr:hypothetical protein [Olleya namhaensis]
MKIRFQCKNCRQINNPDNIQIELPISDELYYEFECHKGHKNKVLVQNKKYDLLFESGLHAMLDGYNREAVSSFAVALERFYEYIISIALVYENGFSFDVLENFKKEVKLSERLYGVFCSIYLLKFKKVLEPFNNKFLKTIDVSFPKFDNQPVKFRNKIIHEGYIPTYQETLNYGIAISKYIKKITEEFRATNPNLFFNFMVTIANDFKKVEPDPNVSNFFFQTFISSIQKTELELDKYLPILEKERNRPLKNN